MECTLIGSTGFIGSTLLKQTIFSGLYHSTDIGNIDGQSLDVVICAGAPAYKWIANQDPSSDLRKIDNLISHLKTITCKKFILISTVDVFKRPMCVNEETFVDEENLDAYGQHRRLLEKFVEKNFNDYLIIRLPGLVGPGLRKNAIFDLLNDNNVHLIDSNGIFQFYPTVNLWRDIQIALRSGVNLLHLTAEPISVGAVSHICFGRSLNQHLSNSPANYDMRTIYAPLFGTTGHYQYNVHETIQTIRTYAQSESLLIKTKPREII